MKTALQLYYENVHKQAEGDLCFMEIVKGGLTQTELQKLIDKRQEVWERYRNWMDKLPK